ncbi:MAG TPA: VWA domain-containing protein [Limnochordales bacterium]
MAVRLADLMGRWQRRHGLPEPRPREGRPLQVDADTQAVFEALRSASRTWTAKEQELGRFAPQAALLLEDLFYAFFAPRVELNPDTAPAFHWNFGILATLLPSEPFQRLRNRTVGDPLMSALASLHVAERLCPVERLSVGLRRVLWSAWSRERGVLRLRLAVGAQGLQALPETVDEPAQHTILRAVDGAAEAVALDERLRGTWGIQPGVRSAQALDDVHGLLAAVRALPGFADLTDAVERFGRLLQPGPPRGRRRGGHGFKRLVGLTWGGDLDRIVPEEAAKLGDAELEDLFREAYEHRRVWQERWEGDVPRNRGPIVCCMDVSRSMNTPAALGRPRFLWAKGVGLALLDVARRGNRTFLGLCFAGENDLAAFEIGPGEYRPDVALEMARCDFDGGTHFQTPLRRALQFLQEAGRKGAQDQGHLVFITDGDAPLPPSFVLDFRAAKAAAGFQMVTVFIDGHHPDLRALSDYTFTVRADRLDAWERTVAGVGRCLR